jgi:tetratricopeptide (TPR) repeat protein
MRTDLAGQFHLEGMVMISQSNGQGRPWRSILLLCLLVVILPGGSLGGEETEAWDNLWGNDYLSAEQQFREITKQDKENVSALRGLLLSRSALGRDLTILDDLKEYSEGAPHSPFDLYLLSWLDKHNGLHNSKYYETLVKFAGQLSKSESYGLVDRRMAMDKMVDYYRILGKANDLNKTAEKLNRIMDWQILGPFDNTSGSGHKKDFIDIDYIPSGVEYKGKFGQKIKWFRPELVDLGGEICTTAYFHKKNYTTSYARTQLKTGKAGQYLLSVGYQGDTEIYVNGHRVFQGDRDSGGSEVVQLLLNLSVGWTNITFKISNREQPAVFTCSLSNPDGSKIDKLEVSPNQGGHGPFDSSKVQRLEGEMTTEIAKLASEDSVRIENIFWDFLSSKDRESRTNFAESCDQILEKYPNTGLIRLAVIEEFTSQDLPVESKVKETVEVAPQLVHAKIHLAQSEMEKKRNKKARTLADEIIEDSKDCLRAHLVRLSTFVEDQLWSDAKTAALRARKVFPEEPFPLHYLALCAEERGARSEVQEYRQMALAKMLPGSRQEYSFFKDWEKEDYKDAKDAIKKMVKIDPSSSRKWTLYVYALIADEDYDKAFETTVDCLESFPQDVYLIQLLSQFVEGGQVFSDKDYREVLSENALMKLTAWESSYSRPGTDEIQALLKKEAAIILHRAINCSPDDLDLRERVANLRGQKSYRTILPDPEIESVQEALVEGSQYPGEDSVILVKQKRRLIFEPGVSLLDHVLAIQILTEDGKDKWENYDLPYGLDSEIVMLQNIILKPDESEAEGRRFFNKIMFPGLEVGDMIFLHFQTTEVSTGKLYNEFWDQHFFVSSLAPILSAQYSLILPKEDKIQFQFWNWQSMDQDANHESEELDNGLLEHRWTVNNLPRAGREFLEPDPKVVYPWLDISTVSRWNSIANWYLDLSGGQMAVTPSVRKKAEELTADCQTDEEKIAAIFNFVANSISYESVPFFQSALIPRLPDEVLRDGFGDCKDKSCLMTAMLTSLDVEGFQLALVTPNAPASRPFLPSPRFNHAIVCRKNGTEGMSWYDPTLENVEAGAVPEYLSGAPALVISEERDSLLEIPRNENDRNAFDANSHIAIQDDGTAVVKRTETIRKVQELSRLRGFYKDKTGKDLAEAEALSLAKQYPGVVVDSVLVDGIKPEGNQLQVTTNFEVPYFGTVDQGIMSIKIPWSSGLQNNLGMVVANQTRKTPFNLQALNIIETDVVTVRLPGLHKLKNLPTSVSLTWQGCSYSVEYEKVEAGLQATRKLRIEGDLVDLENYPGFKDWFDQVQRDLQKPTHLRVS